MMRLELVKRPQRSMLFSALSPFIAFALTIIAGAVLFALLGVNPLSAFEIYFIEPISQVWQLHELAIKAAPLILIAVGLSVCYKANIWNIGAEASSSSVVFSARSFRCCSHSLKAPWCCL